MIPKIIHYCWFGGNPLPAEAKRCIASWRKFLPGYEIREWNESNFDVNIIPFTREAYSVKKYAYVSDYARLWILYKYGGIYFDTDVEAVRPLDDIISKGPFLGIEKRTGVANAHFMVNVGLGFACENNNPIIKEVMRYYETHHYVYPDGHMEQIPIVPITTDVLRKYGFDCENRTQKVGSFTIYPYDYFCPIEFLSTKLEITDNTRTIHHYTATWMSWKDRLKMKKGAFFDKNPIGKLIKKFIRHQ